jgi:hypothetical protein
VTGPEQDGPEQDGPLERRYRRLLAWYPRAHRQEHEDEMLGVVLAGAGGRDRPGPGDRADLILGGLLMRARYAARSFPDSSLAEALAVVLLLVPVLLLPGAAPGLHEIGWWLRYDGVGANFLLTFPAAPVWAVWAVAAVLGLLGRRRAAAVAAVLAGVLLASSLILSPQNSQLAPAEVAPWVLLSLLGAVAGAASPDVRRGLSHLGPVRYGAVVVATVLVVGCQLQGFHRITALGLLPVVVLLASRPATPTGRWVLALLAVPGTAYLITLWDARTDLAVSYGLSAVVAVALAGLLWTVARRRPGTKRGTSRV